MCIVLDGTGPGRAGASPGLADLLLDLASDLLLRGPFWPDQDLDWGYQAMRCAGSTVWLLCI